MMDIELFSSSLQTMMKHFYRFQHKTVIAFKIKSAEPLHYPNRQKEYVEHLKASPVAQISSSSLVSCTSIKLQNTTKEYNSLAAMHIGDRHKYKMRKKN